jgi:hypothetical protein
MTIYVVVGVFEGVVSDVSGFIDPGAANLELERLVRQYGIEPGYEEEPENSVQLHEVEIDARPASVAARQLWW